MAKHPNDVALRRLAIQLAAQLPADATEAEIVLDYARGQLLDFMCGGERESTEKVVPIRPV